MSASTHPISGLPVNGGPSPDLLPADAVFPVGAKLSSRSTRNDIGGVDRIELTNPSKVRSSDGVYRQATPLEQYSGMPNLADAAVVVSNGIATHYSSLLDTTYTVETLGGVKVLKFAAMPTGFEDRHN